jgi:spore germination protein GerM
MNRTGRRALGGFLAAAALALSACGVPISNSPSALPKSQVPNDLLSPVIPPTSTTTAPAGVAESVYLVNPGQKIEAVNRNVPNPANLSAVLDALLAGPSTQEVAQGYSTAIPVGTALLSVITGPANVTLDFNANFGEILGQQQQILAAAQVVETVGTYTAGANGVKGVYFEIEGNPTTVPIATGAMPQGPVNPAMYTDLVATPAPATTTTAAPG